MKIPSEMKDQKEAWDNSLVKIMLGKKIMEYLKEKIFVF